MKIRAAKHPSLQDILKSMKIPKILSKSMKIQASEHPISSKLAMQTLLCTPPALLICCLKKQNRKQSIANLLIKKNIKYYDENKACTSAN